MKPKVFLTGATGFFGSYLKKALIKNGYNLVCLTRKNAEDSNDKLITVSAKNEDFFSKDFLKNAMTNCDAVIHLAAISDSNYLNNQYDRDEFNKINKEFPLILYKAAKESQIKKFIFMSTIKVNGEYTQEVSFSENTPHDTGNRNQYVLSKINTENALINEYEDNNLELLSIIRPPIIYGEGVRGNIKTLIKIIDKGFPLPTTSLNKKRSMVSVYNLADLIINILNSKLTGIVKSCCKDIDISTNDLIKRIAISLNKAKPDFYIPTGLLQFGAFIINKTEMMNKLTKPLLINDNETRENFNWEPSLDFEIGMHKTIDSLIKN